MQRIALMVPVAVMALSLALSFLQPGGDTGAMDGRQWREVATLAAHPERMVDVTPLRSGSPDAETGR